MSAIEIVPSGAGPGSRISRRGSAGPSASRLSRRWRWFAGALLCLGVLWGGLLPTQLGGATSYVITQGISMLPHFHAGDVVVFRSEPSYHVGEVAAYHNGELGVVVMHRIVALDRRRYVFKGDNNQFADTFEPTRSQIVGAEWLHLPGVGRWMQYVRTPAIAAVLLGLLWIYSFPRQTKNRRQRRRHRNAR